MSPCYKCRPSVQPLRAVNQKDHKPNQGGADKPDNQGNLEGTQLPLVKPVAFSGAK